MVLQQCVILLWGNATDIINIIFVPRNVPLGQLTIWAPEWNNFKEIFTLTSKYVHENVINMLRKIIFFIKNCYTRNINKRNRN